MFLVTYLTWSHFSTYQGQSTSGNLVSPTASPMHFISLLYLASSALAVSFHGSLPFAKDGTPLSDALPDFNAKLTHSKRKVSNEGLYVPSKQELADLAKQFDGLVPSMSYPIPSPVHSITANYA